jgi:CysZ protein
VKTNHRSALRIGIFPAIASIIPVLNIFLMALLFPLMTVHTTLNFLAIEKAESR